MGVDRGADQLLHMVRRIASERWISAAEREVVGKFSGLSWMVNNIGTSKQSVLNTSRSSSRGAWAPNRKRGWQTRKGKSGQRSRGSGPRMAEATGDIDGGVINTHITVKGGMTSN